MTSTRKKVFLNHPWLMGLIPVALAFVAHISALKNGFTAFDDVGQVLDNLPRLTSLYEALYYPSFINDTFVYYRPAPWIAFMLARLLSGYEPWGYHLLQVFLHTVNSGLVYLLALHFFKSQKNLVLGALIAAALFAVHPVHIGVVAWISATVETLLTLFFLLAMLVHVQSRDHPKIKIFPVLAALSFFLALMSKETAIVFPLLAFVYDKIFAKPAGRSWKSLIPSYFLYALIFLIYLPLRLVNVAHNLSSHIASSPTESTLRLLAAFGYYFQKVLWPISFNPSTSTLPTTGPFLCVSAFFLILTGFFCVYTLRFSRLLFFHILFYLFCLAPATLISLSVASGLPVGEHYLYLPSYGISVIFAWAALHIGNIFDSPSSKKIATIVGTFLVFIIITTGTVCSYTRARVWRNKASFWSHIAKMNSRDLLPWLNLAEFQIFDNGSCAQATQYFNEAAARLEGAGHISLAKFYFLRSICAYAMGEKDEAINLVKKSIQIFPQPEGYFNLGMIYFKESNANPNENLPLAKEAFKNALGKDKTSSEYAYHFGLTLETMDDIDQAKHYYEYCVALKQDNKWTRMAQERLKNLDISSPSPR